MTGPVTLTFPAHARNVALARSLAAAMSARADLPIDQLEDVRLAVDEAVSQLILTARPDALVTCVFTVTATGLERGRVHTQRPASSRRLPTPSAGPCCAPSSTR